MNPEQRAHNIAFIEKFKPLLEADGATAEIDLDGLSGEDMADLQIALTELGLDYAVTNCSTLHIEGAGYLSLMQPQGAAEAGTASLAA